ncbi:MAG: isoprenylcysteine carboxylmethyltransferase family protein [Planctomycetota bacterium]
MLRFKKVRTSLRRIFILGLLLWIRPIDNPYFFWSGTGLVFLGQLIHFISAGYLTKRDTLVAAGPYRHVRNPFYVGNFLSDLGLCLVAHNPYLLLVYFPLFYLWVIPRRVKKEEAFLLNRFSADYADYLKRVPRFIPGLIPAKLDYVNGQFTWSQIIKNKEIWRVMRAGGLVILFYLRTQIAVVKEGFIPEFNFTPLVSNSFNLITLVIFGVIIILPPIIQFGIIAPRRRRAKYDLI